MIHLWHALQVGMSCKWTHFIGGYTLQVSTISACLTGEHTLQVGTPWEHLGGHALQAHLTGRLPQRSVYPGHALQVSMPYKWAHLIGRYTFGAPYRRAHLTGRLPERSVHPGYALQVGMPRVTGGYMSQAGTPYRLVHLQHALQVGMPILTGGHILQTGTGTSNGVVQLWHAL